MRFFFSDISIQYFLASFILHCSNGADADGLTRHKLQVIEGNSYAALVCFLSTKNLFLFTDNMNTDSFTSANVLQIEDGCPTDKSLPMDTSGISS